MKSKLFSLLERIGGDRRNSGPQIASGLIEKSHVSKPKALGVLLCYNDADILPDAIEALLSNNHELIIWDHGSDDGTAEILDRYASHFVERKFISRDFDFYKLYGEMSAHLRKHYCRSYDWISWPDQDEILEGPARDRSYYDYLTEVINSSYNWVQFRNFNFWFTAEDDPTIVSPVQRIHRYALFADCSPRVRAWRASVTNDRFFNHNPLEGLPDPRPFNLRHYPMRNRAQMLRRLTKDRVGIQRPGANWHYDHMKANEERLTISPDSLHRDDGKSELNPELIFNWRPIYGNKPEAPPSPPPQKSGKVEPLKFSSPMFNINGGQPHPVLRPDPVFILGMHRSGTSALSGALEKLGLSVGKTVMPPSLEMGNPKGYYENQALVDFHDRFLYEIGCSWVKPRPIKLKRFLGSAVREFRKELPPLLVEEFGSARPLIKDPRLCALIPLWRPLIKKNFPKALFVLPIRSPMEVASSLRKRDDLTLNHGLTLWALHVLEAEKSTRGFDRHFLTYEQLLHSPVETLTALAQFLGLSSDAVATVVNQQIDPTLRHHAEVPWPEDEQDRDTILAIHRTLAEAGPGMESKLDKLRRNYYRQKKFRLWI
jgi:glycosyltransferase involved in cell wall biosynthesis